MTMNTGPRPGLDRCEVRLSALARAFLLHLGSIMRLDRCEITVNALARALAPISDRSPAADP
jgi:hypothetical protein